MYILFMRTRSSKPEYQLKIASERIQILFNEAAKAAARHPDRAKRYVKLARKIGMRYNVRLAKHLKIRFCKHCYSYLVPGRNAQQRLKDGILNIKCFSCNKKMRIPYK
jgi:ribonuclease P protein subunit RPR2